MIVLECVQGSDLSGCLAYAHTPKRVLGLKFGLGYLLPSLRGDIYLFHRGRRRSLRLEESRRRLYWFAGKILTVEKIGFKALHSLLHLIKISLFR